MTAAFGDDYFQVILGDDRIVRVVRSAQRFPSVAEFARVNREVVAAARKTGAGRLLLDLRQGPAGRNDEEFEAEGERFRRELARFERFAVLVRTVAGKLQIQRMSKGTTAVFQDEAEALRHLAT
jgi:hypothetical protein